MPIWYAYLLTPPGALFIPLKRFPGLLWLIAVGLQWKQAPDGRA